MPDRFQIATDYLSESPIARAKLGIGGDCLLTPHPIGKGEHNDNYWFEHPETGQKLVLRINYSSQMGLYDQVGYEFEALETLALCPRTPRGLFADNSRSVIDYGVLVEEFVEGASADYHRDDELAACTAILADIHSVKPPDACKLIRPQNPLIAQLETCERLYRTYCESPYTASETMRYVDLFAEQARKAADAPFDARYSCHIQNTEAVPSHFLLTRDAQGRLGEHASMVDWEKPVIGEVAQDLAYFLSPTTTIWDTDVIFSADQRTWLVESYWDAVDGRFERGNFDVRFDAYVKANCLLGITWSCNAWVEYHDPARPLRNEATLELLKTYLSPAFLEQCRAICFD